MRCICDHLTTMDPCIGVNLWHRWFTSLQWSVCRWNILAKVYSKRNGSKTSVVTASAGYLIVLMYAPYWSKMTIDKVVPNRRCDVGLALCHWREIKRQYLQKFTKYTLFHNDKEYAQTLVVVMAMLNDCGFNLGDQHLYSSNITAFDFLPAFP